MSAGMPNQERLAQEVEEALVPTIHVHEPGGAVGVPMGQWKAVCGLVVSVSQCAIPNRKATCEECLRACWLAME